MNIIDVFVKNDDWNKVRYSRKFEVVDKIPDMFKVTEIVKDTEQSDNDVMNYDCYCCEDYDRNYKWLAVRRE